MIHSFTVANFQSFREPTTIDFTLSRKIPLTDWMVEDKQGRVSKLMAVIGPNASGKTALLKTLAFMGWFASESFQLKPDTPIPVEPHFASADKPSDFEWVFEADNTLWRYQLQCTKKRVIREALYRKRERFSYLFIRTWNEKTASYTVKQQDFGLLPQEAKKVRPNASLISWAAQYGVSLAAQFPLRHLVSNIISMGCRPFNHDALLEATQHFHDTPNQAQHMRELLCAWDLGLTGIDFRKNSIQTHQDSVSLVEEDVWEPYGRHESKGKEYNIPFSLESSGTQGAFVLLSRLLKVLQTGGIAVIDELARAHLHPHMLEPILSLFADPATNPKNAQLIFSCHALEVLNLLEKEQVTLVEKNADCESTAYRLDTVSGIRSDDNYYAKYRAGAYGAISNL